MPEPYDAKCFAFVNSFENKQFMNKVSCTVLRGRKLPDTKIKHI